MRMIAKACASLLLAFLLQSTPGKAETFGPWYKRLHGKLGPIDISINLDQLGRSRAGVASIRMGPGITNLPCPKEAHPAFCREVLSFAASKEQAQFDYEPLGVLYEGAYEAFIAFAFGNEETVRLMAIKRQSASSQWADMRIYHPTRGLDAEFRLKITRHLCEISQCMSDRLTVLETNPNAALGFFRDRTFLNHFNAQKDERQQARLSPNVSSNQIQTFHFKNVPDGRSLILRQGPSRDAAMLGEIKGTAHGLKIVSCVPAMDMSRFARASLSAQLRLLNHAWCEIRSPNANLPTGFVPGRYLHPSR